MYIIALDQGTTSCRAILFDDQLNIQASEQEEFTQYYPKPGWVEHDAQEIWIVCERIIKKVIETGGINANQVGAIGITNQRETAVVWDKRSGEPIHHAIVWQDRRTHSTCEKLKKEGHKELIKERTGLVIDAYFSATKVQWLLDHIEGARELADQSHLAFGTIDSWLIWKMTNGTQHVTDPSNASRTMLYNIRENNWDKELLSLFDIPDQVLPQVVDNDGHYGYYVLDGASIPIASVLGDQQAALFGHLCFEKGDAKATFGTGCFILMNTGNEIVFSDHGLLTTLAWRLNGDSTYALEGSVFIAGAAIQWLRDGLEMIDDASDCEKLAFESDPDKNIVFVPAFVGLGAPYWNMGARGAIFGLTRDTSKADIARAALESIAFQAKDVAHIMSQEALLRLQSLKVDGGVVRNRYFMQFLADIIGTSVERPSIVEVTAMGATMLAGINIGLWSPDQLSNLKSIDSLYEASMRKEVREKKYSRWKEAVMRSLDWEKPDMNV